MEVTKCLAKKPLFLDIHLFVSVPFGCFQADIRKTQFNFIDGSNSATTSGAYSSIYLEI